MLDSIEKVEKVCNFAKLVLDNYVKLQNLQKKKYENLEHIMTEDCEIQTPSTDEIYMFDKKVWTVNITNGFIVVNKINK